MRQSGQATTHLTGALRQSILTLLGLGLSGFPFVGADIKWFAGSPESGAVHPLAAGKVFSPFMRAHTEQQSADQEPWSYGVRHEALNRTAIESRYQAFAANLQRNGNRSPQRHSRHAAAGWTSERSRNPVA